MHRLRLLICSLCAITVAGCELFGRQGLPPDPLFVNRKPLESKAKAGPPVDLPFTEPTPAANPYAGD